METPDYEDIERRLRSECVRPADGPTSADAKRLQDIRYGVTATYRLQDAARIIADLLQYPDLPYIGEKAKAFIAGLTPPSSADS
jgi:hypothetical protein